MAALKQDELALNLAYLLAAHPLKKSSKITSPHCVLHENCSMDVVQVVCLHSMKVELREGGRVTVPLQVIPRTK